jgi:predicted nucleotidyltransferase
VRVFWLKQDELIEHIRRVAERVGSADPNVLKIVLFGSLAEGRAVPGSDADILIILRHDPRRFMDRLPEWMGRLSIDFPVDVFPYTEAESETPIVAEALRHGILLLERSPAGSNASTLPCADTLG